MFIGKKEMALPSPLPFSFHSPLIDSTLPSFKQFPVFYYIRLFWQKQPKRNIFIKTHFIRVTFHGVGRKAGRTDGTGGRGTMGGQRTQAVS